MWIGTALSMTWRMALAGMLLLASLTSVVAAESSARVLVLGFVEHGHSGGRLRGVVEERLRRNGESLHDAHLRTRDQACRDEECLKRLGETLRVGRILGGDVEGAANDQVVKVWLWDVERGSLQGQRLVSCADCTEEQHWNAVALAAGQLMEARPLVEPARAALPLPAEATSAPGHVQSQEALVAVGKSRSTERPHYWSTARAAAVGVFGGLTMAAFTLAVAWQVGGLDDASILKSDRSLVGVPRSRTYYGIGGGLLAGLVLSLAIPAGSKR